MPTRSWQEVAALPEFKALDAAQQEDLRNEYFHSVVAPSIPLSQIDAERVKFDAETKPPERNTWWGSDTVDLVQKAAIETGAGTARFLGITPVADYLQEKADYQTKQLSPEMAASMEKPLFSGEGDYYLGEGAKDWRTWLGTGAQLVGGQLPLWAVGGPATAGLRSVLGMGAVARAAMPALERAAVEKLVAQGVSAERAAIMAKPLAEKLAMQAAPDALREGAALTGGYGLAESLASAGGTQAQVLGEVRQAPIQQLMSDPDFQEALQESNGDEQAARELYGTRLGRTAGLKTMLPVAVMGALGGRYIDDLLRGTGAATRFGNSWRTGLSEGSTEGGQGLAEVYAQNTAAQQYDPSRETWKDLIPQTLENVVLGGALGAGIGLLGRPNRDVGTLERAENAGAQAHQAGLNTEPPPSPEELARQQQAEDQQRADALSQQQEIIRQQEEARRQRWVEEEKARQEAERTRREQLKTQREAEKLRQQQAKAGMATGNDDQGQANTPPGQPILGDPLNPLLSGTRRVTSAADQQAGTTPISATGETTPTSSAPAEIDGVPAETEWEAQPAVENRTLFRGQSVRVQRYRSKDGRYEMQVAFDEETGEDLGPPRYRDLQPGQSTPKTPPTARSVVAEMGIGPPPSTGSVAAAPPAPTGKPAPEDDVWSDQPEMEEAFDLPDGLRGRDGRQYPPGQYRSVRVPSRDGRWDLNLDIGPNGEPIDPTVTPRQPGATTAQPPAGTPQQSPGIMPSATLSAPPGSNQESRPEQKTPTPPETPPSSTTKEQANALQTQDPRQAANAPPAPLGVQPGQGGPAATPVPQPLSREPANAGTVREDQEPDSGEGQGGQPGLQPGAVKGGGHRERPAQKRRQATDATQPGPVAGTTATAPSMTTAPAESEGPPSDLVQVVDGYGRVYRVRQRDLDQPERTLLPLYDQQGRPKDPNRKLHRENIVADPQAVPRYRTREALQRGGYQMRQTVRSAEQEQALHGNGFRPVLLAEDGQWELNPWEGIWAKPKKGAWGELRQAQRSPDQPGATQAEGGGVTATETPPEPITRPAESALPPGLRINEARQISATSTDPREAGRAGEWTAVVVREAPWKSVRAFGGTREEAIANGVNLLAPETPPGPMATEIPAAPVTPSEQSVATAGEALPTNEPARRRKPARARLPETTANLPTPQEGAATLTTETPQPTALQAETRPTAEVGQAAAPGTEPTATATPAADAAPETPADWGANNTLVSRERAEELRRRLKAKLGQLNAGLDPEVLAIGTELAVFHIEAGVRRFADLARRLAADLDEPLERLKPYLRSWYNGARDMMEDSDLDVAGMDDPAQVKSQLETLFSTDAKTQQETRNDNRAVRVGDQAPLEEVAAPEMEGAGGQRADGGRDPGRGADGQPGENAADAGRLPGARGRRGGTPRVYPAEAGAQAEGAPGQGARGRRGGRRRSDLGPETPRPTEALQEGDLGSARIDGVPVAPPVIPARNFTITDELALGEGGQVRKYNDNIAAIRIVKTLAAEKRRATPEEQAALARYVGWGGIHQAFPNPETREWAKGWQARGEALRELLGGENSPEYRTARRSTQYAHYTSQAVVEAMWNLAERLGFRGGLLLESAAGIGNFLGLMPPELRGETRAVAVEMDGISARILAALYPQAAAIHSPTNKLPIAPGSFDLAIGNPPYSRTGVRWQYKPGINRFSLHNQFVLADLEGLKANGLYVGVVTHYLLDAQDPAARLEMAAQAEFIGAIRLPNTAFEENALTEVVTDILVFRKRTGEEEQRFAMGRETADQERKKPGTQFDANQLEALDYYQNEIAWTGTTEVPDALGGEPLTVGAWLAANPEMMLGTLERSGTMRQQGELTLKARPGVKQAAALAGAIARFPVNRVRPTDDAIAAAKARFETMAAALEIAALGDEPGAMRIGPDGALTQVLEREIPGGGVELMRRTIAADAPWSPRLLVDEQGRWFELVEKLDEQGNKVKQAVGKALRNVYERKTYADEAQVPASLRLGATRFERLQALVRLRDLLKQQIVLETQGAPATTLEDNRTQLRAAYEAYRARHGLINESKSAALVGEMPDGALVLALELGYKDGISAERAKRVGEKARPATARPAEILSRRVIVPYEPAQRVESLADALAVSLAETGRVNLGRIAALLGVTETEASQQLTGGEEPLAFLDPETQRLETRDAYLSGQVRRKLEAAQAAGLAGNVAALEKVQPALWTSEQVSVKVGANWVPVDVWEAFFNHLTGGQARVTYHRLANAFEIDFRNGEDRLNWDEWGAPNPAGGPQASAAELLTAMLNSRPVRLGSVDDEGRFHLDEAQTELAKLKINQIAMEFADWIFANGERRQRLTALFNEKFNTRVNRQHDGSHLMFPGKVPDQIIRMRRSQKNAVWRGIVEKVLLLDHVVGAGKTFTGIARAMERKRLGLAKKPMIVVPNHLVESWAADVYRLYPGAKILAAGRQDFERGRRRRLFAKIATGDWDLVIMPHSSFGKLGISPETEERYLQQALEEAIQARDEAQAAADEEPQGGRPRKPLGVKVAEALMQKIENRLEALRGKNRDNLLTFEELGVDDLTIDEAHEFKNLFYTSNLQGVRGMGDRAGSQKALDLYNKVRTLHENPNGAVAFMTGTPISNSAVELYTLMRYLAPQELEELGLEHFDAWRAQYVDSQTSWEMNDTARLQEVTRLGPNWSNMRSLMELYYSFSDAVTLEDLRQAYAEDNNGERFPVPDVKGGGRRTIKADPTPAQANILAEVVAGFNALPDEPDPDVRNAQRLRLMDRARKVSLDARAVDPRLPTAEPGGKLEKATAEILRLYRQWHADRGTQLVFLDRSVPKSRQDAAVLRDYDRAMAAREAAIRDNDEEGLQWAEDALGRFDPLEMQALREAQAGGWNAYQQLKDNLVAQGIPANEIRFVQEANTDEQKKALFDAVNLGEVRVLIGSTARMGAGTNVQERLVGLHHLDVNWRPADIEQREGRIIRQGNSLLDKYGFDGFDVEILAYVTERTVDAKMWELNAKKLKNVNGIRKYNGEFEMEFSDEEAVSMAETAALASGDPLLLERVRLNAEIQKLELLERAHRRKSFAIEDRVSELERIVATYPRRIEATRAEVGRLAEAMDQARTEAEGRRVSIEGQTFTWEQKLAALQAAEEAVTAQKDGKEHGRYALNIDGQRYTTKESYTEAIDRALGDAGLFAVDIQDQTHGSRTMAARGLTELVNARLGAMEPGSRESFRAGKMLGATLTLDLVQARTVREPRDDLLARAGARRMFDNSANDRGEAILTLERDGITLEHASSSFTGGSPWTVTSARDALHKLWSRISERAEAGTGYLEAMLEGAKTELPEVKAKRGQPFPQAEELTSKRQRLVEVIRTLAVEQPQGEATAAGAVPAMATGTATELATGPKATETMAEAGAVAPELTAETAADAGPRYAQGQAQGPRVVKAEAERLLARALGGKAAEVLLDSGIVRLTNAGSRYQGVTWRDGSLYLNLDALTAGNFEGVLYHEGFHAAVRDLLGEETYQALMGQLEKMLAREVPWVERAKDQVPKGTAAANVTEEVAAYAIQQVLEDGEQPGLLRRWAESFLSALRAAIIRRFPAGRLKNWALANLKPMDLARLARAGLLAKARGMKSMRMQATPVFSIASISQTGKPKPGDVILVDGKEIFSELPAAVVEEARQQSGARLTPAPIKLMYGQHEGSHRGFGLAHIEAEHGDEIRALGMSPEEFVLEASKGATQVWEDGKRLVLAHPGRKGTAMVIELMKEDGYYSVVTAFPSVKPFKKFGKLVWRGRALAGFTQIQADGLDSQRSPLIDQQPINPPEPLSRLNALHPPLETLRGQPGDENIDPNEVAGNPDIRFSLASDADGGGSPLGGGKALFDSIKQTLADQWTGKLGTSLGALTLRQLAEVGAKWLPGIEVYDKLRTRMETRRNVMMEEAGKLGDAVQAWAKHRDHRAEARAVFELMNDATLAQVDPANYQTLKIPLQLGPGPEMLRNWEATPANVQELRRRVGVWKKSADHRERALAAYYAEAARTLAMAVKAEKKRQAALPDLYRRWQALSSGATHLGPDGAPFLSEQEALTAMGQRRWPKGVVTIAERVKGGWAIQELGAKEVYLRFRDLYKQRSDDMLQALLARIEALEGLNDADKRQLAAKIRAEFENPMDAKGNLRVGPYFPLQRFGRYYVFARRFPEGEARTFTRQDGAPFASEKAALAALYKREDLKGISAWPVELEDGSGWTLEEQGEPGFWLFESVAERRAALEALRSEGWEIRRQGLTAEAHRELQGVSEGFIAGAVDKLKKQGATKEADALYQMYLQTLQQMSIRKHFIHRKGTAGYTDDQLRAFGYNMTRLAHQISKLEAMPNMEKTLLGMETSLKEEAKLTPGLDTTRGDALLEELKKRHEWIANPENSPWTNAVAAMGFLFYLGVSPAAAIVNMSQVPIVALPALAARVRTWSRAAGTGRAPGDGGTGAELGEAAAWKAAGSALTTAFLDVARGFKPAVIKGFLTGRPLPSEAANLTPDERRAFAEWDKTGARDRTQAHNLAGIGDADTWFNGPAFNRVMGAISSLFHAAEVVNRDATLLAGYRLARAQGLSHDVALAQAEEATWESHFDYGNNNRARFMQKDVAKVLLMFKNYAQHVFFFLGRNLYLWAKGESPEVRAEARTKFAGMVGMTALFAGAQGLPIGGAFVLANLLHALFGDDDEPWDAEVEFRNLLARTFPKTLADIVDRGAVNKLTGLDFSSRTSIADLMWRAPDRDLDGAGMFQHIVEQMLGPVGGIASRPFTLYDELREGRWGRAAEAAAPKALKDVGQMLRFATEGVKPRSATLQPIMEKGELSSWQLFAKALGFTPDDLAVRYDANKAVRLYEQRIKERRQTLMMAAALAMMEKDPLALREARAKIAVWNREVPKWPILEAGIRQSVRSRERMRERSAGGVVVNPKLDYLREEAGGFGR